MKKFRGIQYVLLAAISFVIFFTLSRMFLFTSGGETKSSVEQAMLSGPNLNTYYAIKIYAPEEYDTIIRKFVSIVNSSKNKYEGRINSMNLIIDLRRKYARFALSAPDENLRSVVKSLVDLAHALSSDWTLCNELFVNGIGNVPRDAVMQNISLIDLHGAAVFRALFEGKKSKAAPRIASDSDWNAVGARWAASGATDADIESVSDPKVDDPNLCHATISMLETILVIDGAAGERVRASFTAEAAAN